MREVCLFCLSMTKQTIENIGKIKAIGIKIKIFSRKKAEISVEILALVKNTEPKLGIAINIVPKETTIKQNPIINIAAVATNDKIPDKQSNHETIDILKSILPNLVINALNSILPFDVIYDFCI